MYIFNKVDSYFVENIFLKIEILLRRVEFLIHRELFPI